MENSNKPLRSISLVFIFISTLTINGQRIGEFAPILPNPLNNGGRVHSIAVSPADDNLIFASHELCGLWKSKDKGAKWEYVENLKAVFTRDIAIQKNGVTVIATLGRDCNKENGGGIWVSNDLGNTWHRPTNFEPPSSTRNPKRISGHGISYAPDDINKVYVGTDYGIAVSNDNGINWNHYQLPISSAINRDSTQNAVYSVLALSKNRVIGLTKKGAFKSDDGGVNWSKIKNGDFVTFGDYKCFKCIANSPIQENNVFILESYRKVLIYEVNQNNWSTMGIKGGGSRGPFIQVSRSPISGFTTVWAGTGRTLRRVTRKRIRSFQRVDTTDWTVLDNNNGLHADAGYLALDNDDLPLIYGCDGGLFKPINKGASKWESINTNGSGLNTLQIMDMAGTLNQHTSEINLYIGTQDNSVWSSLNGGQQWNNHDCCEGYDIEVPHVVKLNKDALVVYKREAGDKAYKYRTSSNNLVNIENLSDRLVNGDSIDMPNSAVLLSEGPLAYRYIRSGIHEDDRFLFVSKNNGKSWNKRGLLDGIKTRGIAHVSDPSQRGSPKLYIPVTGSESNADGSPRIGLIFMAKPYNSGVVTYNESSVIYLPNNGSIGRRATMFDWQAVFEVHPYDDNFIIVPDIVNKTIMITKDGGLNWEENRGLTELITDEGKYLLWDHHEYRMQITKIAFDPFNPNRIFIGTRDNGIFYSDNQGIDWAKIPYSEKIIYPTAFVFDPINNVVFVSTNGRGLWKIYFNLRPHDGTHYRGSVSVEMNKKTSMTKNIEQKHHNQLNNQKIQSIKQLKDTKQQLKGNIETISSNSIKQINRPYEVRPFVMLEDQEEISGAYAIEANDKFVAILKGFNLKEPIQIILGSKTLTKRNYKIDGNKVYFLIDSELIIDGENELIFKQDINNINYKLHFYMVYRDND